MKGMTACDLNVWCIFSILNRAYLFKIFVKLMFLPPILLNSLMYVKRENVYYCITICKKTFLALQCQTCPASLEKCFHGQLTSSTELKTTCV